MNDAVREMVVRLVAAANVDANVRAVLVEAMTTPHTVAGAAFATGRAVGAALPEDGAPAGTRRVVVDVPAVGWERLDALAAARGKSPEACLLDMIGACQPGGGGWVPPGKDGV